MAKSSITMSPTPGKEKGDMKLRVGFQAWYDNGQLAEQCHYHFGDYEGWYTG
jgi:hypothetical protein